MTSVGVGVPTAHRSETLADAFSSRVQFRRRLMPRVVGAANATLSERASPRPGFWPRFLRPNAFAVDRYNDSLSHSQTEEEQLEGGHGRGTRRDTFTVRAM